MAETMELGTGKRSSQERPGIALGDLLEQLLVLQVQLCYGTDQLAEVPPPKGGRAAAVRVMRVHMRGHTSHAGYAFWRHPQGGIWGNPSQCTDTA